MFVTPILCLSLSTFAAEPPDSPNLPDLPNSPNSPNSPEAKPEIKPESKPEPEPTPRIDYITMGVGRMTYSIFGHAAIRVRDTDGSDTAYNFGGVDLDQPNFWLKLMQGRLDTFLDVKPYSQLLLDYSAEDRTIVGHTLRFTPEQAHAIIARLKTIASSEERNYRYHHVLDNCTTRIVHLFDGALGGEIERQAQYFVSGTYRDRIIEQIRDRPWLYLAMDLAGNGLGDVELDAWKTIFMPDAVTEIFQKATINGGPFVMNSYTDYRSVEFEDRPEWDWPWNKVYILFVFPLCLLIYFRPRAGAFILGTVFSALGVMYVVFWLASDYIFYHRNWNLLLFPPTHLVLAAIALRTKWWTRLGAAINLYAGIHLLLGLVLAVLAWSGAIVQAIGPMLGAALPLALVLTLRTRQRSLSQVPEGSAMSIRETAV